MNVQVTESGTWRRTLEIEAPVEAVNERLDAAYRKYSKTLSLPGFRKGKIPLSVVKQHFGKAIQGEVIQEMVGEFYQDASEAEGIHPVSQAEIEDIEFEEGQPLVFKASVDVRPEITVEAYKGLRVTRPASTIGDDHVERQLQMMQDAHAKEQVVARAAELEDVVLADVEELGENGDPVPDHGSGDQSIRLFKDDEGNPVDFAEQLVGISAGETREITITRAVADDHEHCDHDHGEEVQKESVQFRVMAKEIRERVLPELTDEWARDVGNAETLDALKTQLRDEMQVQYNQIARQRVEENLIDALIEGNPFEIPDSMIETHLDNMIESYKQEHADHDHEIDEDAMRENGRDQAEFSIRRYLLLNAVAAQENIEVTGGDLDGHLAEMSQRHSIEGPRLRQILSRTGQLDQIYADVKTQKTFDFLIANANVEDVEEVESDDG